MAELFGFKITRANQSGGSDGFTAPSTDDGTLDIVSGGGHYASILDMDGRDRNELDLIRRYRDIAQQPECDSAIEDIANEAIVSDERDKSVSLSLDRLDVSPETSSRKCVMSLMRYYIYLILVQKDMTSLDGGMSMDAFIITKLLIKNLQEKGLKNYVILTLVKLKR